jgi:hypothetical protein
MGNCKYTYVTLKNKKYYTMRIKRFNELITEDTATTGMVGSGTAVGFGTQASSGTFTSSAGMSVSGGDTGTSFSTNSNMNGMGAVKSSQPSMTPGDVAGSTKGSGDIGANLGGVYTKGEPRTKKKKKKSTIEDKVNKAEDTYIKKFSDMYTGNFTNEAKKNDKYSYVAVKNNDTLDVYIIPYNSETAYKIGNINEDSQFVLFNKFKFKKLDLNELEIIQLSNKQRLEVEQNITKSDIETIEKFINA